MREPSVFDPRADRIKDSTGTVQGTLRYRVVRIGLRGNDAETLGTYRYRLPARVHRWWANIGLRMAEIREEIA
jgi:hypothetical protein